MESSTNPMAAAAALSSSIPSDNASARRNNHTSNREHPPINHRSALRRSRAAADRISQVSGRADRAAHLSRARRVDPASSPPSRPREIRERGGELGFRAGAGRPPRRDPSKRGGAAAAKGTRARVLRAARGVEVTGEGEAAGRGEVWTMECLCDGKE